MRVTVAALLLTAACSAPQRGLTIVPALPPCLGGATVNSVRVTALGDFPPAPALTAAASATASATLALPPATRVVALEGFGPTGLAAFGRTAPLSLGDVAGGALPLAYGPPDGLCATGAPLLARAGHHATRLGSGAVLVTGGWTGSGAATNIEIYLPGGDTQRAPAHFRLADATLAANAVLLHGVAALPDGGALVSGGVGVDPEAGTADGIASQGATRHGPDGRVRGQPLLLVDGPRAGHSATTLPDGRVLLAGGCTELQAGRCVAGRALATTLVYDPAAAETFRAGPRLGRARWGHEALVRGDGTVLLVGGLGEDGAPPAAELVDLAGVGPDVGSFAGAAARLPTGAVLVAGGVDAPAADAALWLGPRELPLPLLPLGDPRQAPTVTALDDGAALVAGGGGNGALYLYDGRGALTTLAAALPARGHSATLLADGTVLLLGGVDDSGAPAARAHLFFRSLVSPYANLPTLTLDGPGDPYLPRRPDRALAAAGQLTVTAAAPVLDGRPAEWALLAGATVADFDFDLRAGRRASDAEAAVIVGWQSEARYGFVVVAPNRRIALYYIPSAAPALFPLAPDANCSGVTLDPAELPDGSLAPLHFAWRRGRFTVSAAGRALLDCRPATPLGRGSVGVAALAGSVAFGSLTLSR